MIEEVLIPTFASKQICATKMAQDREAPQASQTEEPVRERLEKTTIAKNSTQAEESAPMETDRGRGPTRKRSHEELEDRSFGEKTAVQPTRHHSRKRSRGSSPDEVELNNGSRKSGEKPRTGSLDAGFAEVSPDAEAETVGEKHGAADEGSVTPERRGDKRAEATVEDMTSPKTKRSRLHSTAQDETPETAPAASSVSKPATSAGAWDSQDEQLKPSTEEPAKIPPGSGFANTSVTSPFGSLAGSASPFRRDEAKAPGSAFTASGFGALSQAPTSGFGAVSKSTGGFGIGGSFATGSKSPSKSVDDNKGLPRPEPPTSSAFGGRLGTASAFSSTARSESPGFGSGSGFGKIGSGNGFGSGGGGFGSLGGGGSGLTSFASGKPSVFSGSKPAKPFGAPADDDENDENEEDETPEDSAVRSPLNQEEDPKDERFFERDLETGEEEEETHFTARAKLYIFATLDDNGGTKEWRERGLGTVRLNIHTGVDGEAEEDQPASKKARLVMRAEGSHRVVLNTPVKKEIHFGSSKGGGPPANGYMFFQGVIDGKESLQLLQLKMKQQNALELHEKIEEFKKFL
ncbi:hypothetical protein K431DRAFT_268459 [Polychaeton citri CBS 116435]|uniref:RanBD1 domain-containing protein n=1 Tax=Polychaeton citri CBS 116435 TaxID=1314669 RepID=A0A9P4Q8H5_9PEZI|nr:hypothetical protein K431DRAFT_268459 [Polychaeton citri CBS 116435]